MHRVYDEYMNKLIYIIIASTRPNRIGDKIAEWVLRQVQPVLAQNDINVQLVDLEHENLPVFNEPEQPKNEPEYAHPYTRHWSAKIAKADGFIIVTPEYNHSYPASIKNAIDYLYKEWVGKPMAFVGYGWGGGKRAVAHLRDVAGGVGATAIDAQVAIMNGDILDGAAIKTPVNVALASYGPHVAELANQLVAALAKSAPPADSK